MKREQISDLLISLILGLLVGAVLGVISDRLIGEQIFSRHLLKKPIIFEIYIMKLEIQLSPGALAGLLVVSYLALKKRF